MASTTDAAVSLIEPSLVKDHPKRLATAKPLSLKRNAVWTTVGNGAYAAAQWLQVALIAHLGSSADVGRYALALGTAAPVFMFFNLQLRPIQATDSTGRNTFGEYLGLRLLSSLCGLVTVACLAAFAHASFTVVALILLIGTFKAIESISDIYQGLLQQFERMDYVGRSMLLRSGLILGTFATAYYLTHKLYLGAAAMVCAQLTCMLFYDIRAGYITLYGSAAGWRRVARVMMQPDWNQDRLTQLAIRALPLGITMMLISLYANLPRFVLNKYMGPSGVGVFAAIMYISMLGGLLVTAVGTAASPRLAQYALTDKRAYYRLLGRLAAFAGGLGVIGITVSILFGRELLQALYGSEYARHTDVLVWSMTAGAISYISSAFGFGATALGRFKAQPWIVGVATAVLLCADFALIPSRGVTGAASATVMATFVWLCGFLVLVLRRAR